MNDSSNSLMPPPNKTTTRPRISAPERAARFQGASGGFIPTNYNRVFAMIKAPLEQGVSASRQRARGHQKGLQRKSRRFLSLPRDPGPGVQASVTPMAQPTLRTARSEVWIRAPALVAASKI